MTSDARTDWETRIGNRSGTMDAAFAGQAPVLSPPAGLVAEAGGHQVTLFWHPVPGAIGYQVHTAPSADGPFEPIRPGARGHERQARPELRSS